MQAIHNIIECQLNKLGIFPSLENGSILQCFALLRTLRDSFFFYISVTVYCHLAYIYIMVRVILYIMYNFIEVFVVAAQCLC